MDDAGTHSPDPDPQPAAAPLPTAAPAPEPAAQKTPFLAMSWPRRRRVGAILAAVALATTGGVAIAATSGTPSPSPSVDGSSPSPQEMKQKLAKQMSERGSMVRGMKGGMGLGPGGAIYGEFVTPDGDGYATHLMQTGTVSSVGDSSLEVKSADGHTQSYVLNSDTIVNGARGWTAESKGGVASGQRVTVVATKSGDTATATMINARDAKTDKGGMMGDGNMRMFKFRGGPGGMMPGGGEIQRFGMKPGDKMVMPREVPDGMSPDDQKMLEEKMMQQKKMMQDGEVTPDQVEKATPSSAS